MESTIEVKNLWFRHSGGVSELPEIEAKRPFALEDLSFTLPLHSRVLFIGPNGAGKSTLLRLLAGKRLPTQGTVTVAGHSPFYEVGFDRRLSLIEGEFPLTLDLTVQELLQNPIADRSPRREADLIRILAINPAWHMNRISDGQRRRVQILLALRRQLDVLFLDEVTIHLDLLGRLDLLNWLRDEHLHHGLSIVYTTHILDGLWQGSQIWPTHLFLLGGKSVCEVIKLSQADRPQAIDDLSKFCLQWMRQHPV